MKKLARFCAAVLALAAVLTVAGCSARTPVSADNFQKQAKSQGFTVTDNSASNTDATKYLDAVKDDSDTTLTFISFGDDSSAQDRYNTLKQQDSPNGGGNSLDSATYNKYTATNGELYYEIIRMDNTVVSCKTTVSHEKEIEDFLKAIKY